MLNNFTVFIKSLIFTQIFVFCLIAGVSIDINSYYLNISSPEQLESILQPFNKLAIDEEVCVKLFKKTSFAFAGDTKSIINSDYILKTMPQQLLSSNIQALAFSESRYAQANVSRNDHRSTELPANNIPVSETNTEAMDYEKLKNYLVVFYCTHNSETYIPESGAANLKGGKPGLVNQIAALTASQLNKKGVKSRFVNTIHDYPNYNASYTNSRATVKKILQSDYENLWLFDIHRDSIPGLSEAQRVKINGKHAAPILIIVGTDERKEHSDWKKNLAFAEQIRETGEKMYPGLIKGIRTKAGTYNQEFHSQSLLLEFGSDYNSLAETSYSAELLADVFLEILKEENS
ncbi:MAG: hypothetical protein GX808_11810 [Syntrophomonadaceae bacterium]|nr:hypothetical protein [Syntrophomonadaceae bacterium]